MTPKQMTPTTRVKITPDSEPAPQLMSSRPSVSSQRRGLQMSERRLFLGIGDQIAISSALAIALSVGWSNLGLEAPSLLWFAVLSAAWLLVAPAFGVYDLKVAADVRTAVFAVWQAASVVVIVYFLVPYLSAPLLVSRAMMLVFTVSMLALLAAWRAGYAVLISHPRFRVRVLILGAGQAGQSVADAIEANAPQDYELLGFLDDDPSKQGSDLKGVPVLSPPDSIMEMARSLDVRELIVAISGDIRPELHRALIEAFESGLRILSMDEVYEAVTSRLAVEHAGQRWFVTLPAGGSGGILHELVRRALDIVAGAVGSGVFGLLFIPVAVAIKLDSPGPALYMQERIGKNGKKFRLMKFRSMGCDAERDGVAVWASRNDPRVTRVGRVLRSTRLDELPQFLAILKGEMSLIGPRPERPEFVEKLQAQIPFYRARLLVSPGLTGWAQVMYRYGSTSEDALIKLQYDLYYVKHRSFYLDFLIILRTIGVVLRRTGT